MMALYQQRQGLNDHGSGDRDDEDDAVEVELASRRR